MRVRLTVLADGSVDCLGACRFSGLSAALAMTRLAPAGVDVVKAGDYSRYVTLQAISDRLYGFHVSFHDENRTRGAVSDCVGYMKFSSQSDAFTEVERFIRQ